ncbi:hypothetical protein PLICRDRAFT_700943 [Plicaturopsis crispa FD-325 SS-3]|nr:hypothetical protein PLICRDRAFT_700943 [Plicaturopsis crispa FD-325 SS-3]
MSEPISLYDILHTSPPFAPEMYSPTITSSTRGISDFEFNYDAERKLHGIVYHEELVEQLLPAVEQWVSDLQLNDDHKPHAAWRNEEDSVYWWRRVFGDPALSGLRAAIRRIIRKSTSPLTDSPWTGAAFTRKNLPTPDLELIKDPWVRGQVLRLISAIFEFKTGNSLPSGTFQDMQAVFYDDQGEQIAFPFKWPVDDGSEINKETKILVQVFSQLISRDAVYAFLSSYESTIFFYRAVLEGKNILYISNTYSHDTLTPAHVLAWMAQALDILPDSPFEVPTPNISYLDLPMHSWEPGVNLDIVQAAHGETPKARKTGKKPSRSSVRLMQEDGDNDKTPTKAGPSKRRQPKSAAKPSTRKRSRTETEGGDDEDEGSGPSNAPGPSRTPRRATAPKRARVETGSTAQGSAQASGHGNDAAADVSLLPVPGGPSRNTRAQAKRRLGNNA